MKKITLYMMLIMLCTTIYAHDMKKDSITNVTECPKSTGKPHQVITNGVWDNWFLVANIGGHAFFGDYSSIGSFSDKLSPDFNIGFGKWFTPVIGMKIQFGGFTSKGYSEEITPYTHGNALNNGSKYWRSKIKWWDLNINAMFNLTRLFMGYEGIDSDKRFNQFILSTGLGAVHHWDTGGRSLNEWSGHLELQYSRFFTKKKALSLDLKMQGIFYDTNFDAIDNKANGKSSHKWDMNIGASVGLTYYFNKRGWEKYIPYSLTPSDDYEIDRLNEELNNLRAQNERLKDIPVMEPTTKTIVFPYLVNFTINKTDIVNREKVNLKAVSEMIKASPEKKYNICGYADKYTGSVKRNQWLAENRAKNVYKILTEEFGVHAEQLTVEYKGGVDNMFYNDPQVSRSVIITEAK